MKEKRMKDVLESIAQRNVPDDVNLWPQIAAQVERKSIMLSVRTRPAAALLIVLLALALLSSVAYAIGKATGYIPGVGLVDQSVSLRILAEPVSVERDGITVTVDQLVADLDRTFVAYTLGGIRIPQGSPAMCHAIPSLQLPGGSSLDLTGGGAGGYGGEVGTLVKFETTVYYSPIPAGVDHVTFGLDCILPEGTGPENWQLPLVLVPAPEGFATPAVEVGATFVAAGPTFDGPSTPTSETEGAPFQSDPSLPNTPTPVSNGSGLYLDQVMELPDSYLLVGNFTDAGDLPGPFMATGSAYDYVPRITYGNGNPVDFKVRDDIKPVNNWGGAHYWAYEIAKPVQGPLTVTLDQINVYVSDKTQFTFDTGPNPQVGRKWELNLPIHLRNYDYVLDTVEMIKDGYRFNYHSGTNAPEGVSLEISIVGSFPERQDGKLINQKTVVTYSDSFTYPVPLPTGQLTVEVGLTEVVPLQGPWRLTWTPPNQ